MGEMRAAEGGCADSFRVLVATKLRHQPAIGRHSSPSSVATVQIRFNGSSARRSSSSFSSLNQCSVALLWLALSALTFQPLAAQEPSTATITGVVQDSAGSPLPGVTVTVAAGRVESKVVTDLHGRYAVSSVPAGAHRIRAALAGFAPREERGYVAAGVSARIDFVLCPGPFRFIDWIAPPSQLPRLFALATVVAHVRVTATEPSEGECREQARVTATVLESLKHPDPPMAGVTLTFSQEQWLEEPTPYPVGSELIVFLNERGGSLWRSHGPFADFLVDAVRP